MKYKIISCLLLLSLQLHAVDDDNQSSKNATSPFGVFDDEVFPRDIFLYTMTYLDPLTLSNLMQSSKSICNLIKNNESWLIAHNHSLFLTHRKLLEKYTNRYDERKIQKSVQLINALSLPSANKEWIKEWSLLLDYNDILKIHNLLATDAERDVLIKASPLEFYVREGVTSNHPILSHALVICDGNFDALEQDFFWKDGKFTKLLICPQNLNNNDISKLEKFINIDCRSLKQLFIRPFYDTSDQSIPVFCFDTLTGSVTTPPPYYDENYTAPLLKILEKNTNIEILDLRPWTHTRPYIPEGQIRLYGLSSLLSKKNNLKSLIISNPFEQDLIDVLTVTYAGMELVLDNIGLSKDVLKAITSAIMRGIKLVALQTGCLYTSVDPEDSDVREFAAALENHDSLEVLTFALPHLNLTEPTKNMLINSFGSCCNLKHINIHPGDLLPSLFEVKDKYSQTPLSIACDLDNLLKSTKKHPTLPIKTIFTVGMPAELNQLSILSSIKGMEEFTYDFLDENPSNGELLINELAKHPTIKTIKLDHVPKNNEISEAIGNIIRTSKTLESLYLSSEINAEIQTNFSPIASAIKTNKNITNLILEGDNFCPNDFNSLLIENTTLKNLVITMKDSNSGFMEMLKQNNSLKNISIFSRFYDENVMPLSEAISSNHCLEEIIFSDILMTDVGMKDLANSLKSNNTLKTIKIITCGLNIAGYQSLAEALKVNQTLSALYIYYPLSNVPQGEQLLRDAVKDRPYFQLK